MTIEQSTLNSGALVNGGSDLQDGTTDSQKPAVRDHTTPSAEDLKRGYSKPAVERISEYDPQLAGGENTVGSPFDHHGGFLGRPTGYQR
jgi:hypothetical protein